MTTFSSLYLPGANNAAESIRTALAALGYQFFDPFGLIPGKAYPQAVRLFVAPARGGWTRVLGEPDPALLPPFSQIVPCLLVALDGSDARIEVYANGEPSSPETALASYLASPDCLDRPPASEATGVALGGVALGALPDDVQALAQRVDLKTGGIDVRPAERQSGGEKLAATPATCCANRIGTARAGAKSAR
ncbi:MAG: hypothetical protein U0521_27755 [Anaerolineae bacterium]